MLVRFDPFREFDRLAGQARGGGAMPMDAYRQGDTFVVHFDLPGVESSSIDLTVEKDVLTVTAKRQWAPAEGLQVIASERPQGTFTRQLLLGNNVDTEHVDASYDNGVLTVRVPVAEKAKPRKVEITSGGDAKQLEASAVSA